MKDAFVLEGNGNAAEVMPGVAIIANSTWEAFKAKAALKVEWDESQASKDNSLPQAAAKAAKIAKGAGTPRHCRPSRRCRRRVLDGGKMVEAFYSTIPSRTSHAGAAEHHRLVA